MTNTWKAVERAIARLLGGERIGVTGRADGNVADVLAPDWAVEVKSYAKVPDKLRALAEHTPCRVIVCGSVDGRPIELRTCVGLLRDVANERIIKPRGAIACEITLPAWASKAFMQAAKASRNHSRPPLVVIHKRRQPIDESLAFYGFDARAVLSTT